MPEPAAVPRTLPHAVAMPEPVLFQGQGQAHELEQERTTLGWVIAGYWVGAGRMLGRHKDSLGGPGGV